jgi:hypothetical protein
MSRFPLLLLFYGIFVQPLAAQPAIEALFTPPRMYRAVFAKNHIIIDGKLNESDWQQARWSENFIDIEGDLRPTPSLPTRMKMLWSDSCLYVAARLQEPQVWATLRQHDAIIFHDNDFEVFIDPYNTTQPYFEIEVNAVNTIFDLLLPKPYRNGGSALIGWDVQGLQSAISVQGTLNKATDNDSGWTVEMAIPYRALTLGNEVHVPKEGEQWRINFSRVEWDTEVINGVYVKRKGTDGKNLPEHNWVWSPQGVVNMHYPERWGYVQFSKSDTASLHRPIDEPHRNLLWQAYYRQKEWYKKHGRYAASLADINLTDSRLQMEVTTRQFIISTSLPDGGQLTINQDGLIEKPETSIR